MHDKEVITFLHIKKKTPESKKKKWRTYIIYNVSVRITNIN